MTHEAIIKMWDELTDGDVLSTEDARSQIGKLIAVGDALSGHVASLAEELAAEDKKQQSEAVDRLAELAVNGKVETP